MRIPFEDWLSKQDVSEHTYELFKEAFQCYRGEAYRGALILSFLGFHYILRERILLANIPTKVIEIGKKDYWETICTKLKDLEQSDMEIKRAVEMKTPFDIFNISDDLRTQYIYWKDRRNDCAHGKPNLITVSHIECFWSFIQSNLAKFQINGSEEHLLRQFDEYFDYIKTPRGISPKSLVQQIPQAVPESRYPSFIVELGKIAQKHARLFEFNDLIIPVITQIFDTCTDTYITMTKDYLSKDLSLLKEILKDRPSILYEFKDSPTLIRQLWVEKSSSYLLKYLFWSLLKYNLVPPNEWNDFVKEMSERLDNHTFIDLSPEDRTLLIDTEYVKLVGYLAFKEAKISGFDWARENKEVLCLYLQTYGWDSDIAQTLYNVLSRPHYPEQFTKRLIQLFEEEPELYSSYIKLCEQEEINIPRQIEALKKQHA